MLQIGSAPFTPASGDWTGQARRDVSAPVPAGPVASGPGLTETVARAPGRALATAPEDPARRAPAMPSPDRESRIGADRVSPDRAESRRDMPEMPRPAPPLKTFATIPTEITAEIARIREEAAMRRPGGPGNDPTPMPAPAEAIGPSAVPLDDTTAPTGRMEVHQALDLQR